MAIFHIFKILYTFSGIFENQLLNCKDTHHD